LDVIKYQGRSGEVIDYFDVDDGKTIKFTYKTKGDYGEMIGHGFEDRIDPATKKKYVVEDEFIEQAAELPLDRLLKRLTYDEVAAIYLAETPKKKHSEDEPPVSRRRTAAVVEEPETEQEETPPPTRRRRTATVEEPASPKEGECPSGLRWGIDTLHNESCDDCPVEFYNPCSDEQARLAALEPAPRRRRR
jgi:hypothetical protein